MFRKYFPAFCLFTLLASCGLEDINFDNIEVEEWQPTFAVPIFDGSVTVADMVAEVDSSFLEVRSDGLLQFVYSEKVISFDVDETISVPDFNAPRQSTTAFPISFTTPTPITVNDDFEVDLALSPTELYSILLKSGQIRLSFNSDFDFNVTVTIDLPTAKLNGVAFSQQFQIPANSNGFVQNLDLTGYEVSCETDAGVSTPNRFPVAYEFVVPANSTIRAGDQMDIDLGIRNIFHKVARCNLTQRRVELPADTITVTAYDNTFDVNDLTLDSPKIEFEIINRYGIPFNFDFGLAQTRNTSNGSQLDVQFSTLPVFLDGFSTVDDFTITNFPALFDLRPDEVRYATFGDINPNGPATLANPNILTDTSNVEGIATITLPFIGSGLLNFSADTTDVDLSLDDDIDEFISAEINLIVDNSLAFDADVQFYFLDDNGVIIDSLFNAGQTMFAGASTDANGNSIGPERTQLFIELDADKLQRILETKKMTMIGTFKSTGTGSVRVNESDQLDVKIGLKTNVAISINE